MKTLKKLVCKIFEHKETNIAYFEIFEYRLKNGKLKHNIEFVYKCQRCNKTLKKESHKGLNVKEVVNLLKQ